MGDARREVEVRRLVVWAQLFGASLMETSA